MEPRLPKNPTREQLDRWAHTVSYSGNPTPPSLRRKRRVSSALRAGAIVFGLRRWR